MSRTLLYFGGCQHDPGYLKDILSCLISSICLVVAQNPSTNHLNINTEIFQHPYCSMLSHPCGVWQMSYKPSVEYLIVPNPNPKRVFCKLSRNSTPTPNKWLRFAFHVYLKPFVCSPSLSSKRVQGLVLMRLLCPNRRWHFIKGIRSQ